MSVESFVQAMPKAELHVHLEGSVPKDTLMVIAEQNDIPETLKHFNQWVGLLDKPDYERIDDIVRVTSQWVRLPEDLTRMVYNLGVQLAKQNVRYAEVTVNPALYTELTLTLEQFFAAINDGRDRAHRAWGVRMGWILAVPREEPRRADDIVRWITTVAARRAGVVAMGLVGKESAQPVGQFERPFHAAEKKSVPRVIHAGELLGADGVLKVLEQLMPTRVTDGWGAADSADVVRLLVDNEVAVDVSMARPVLTKKIANYANYPLRKLVDAGVVVTIGSDMPMLFKTGLNDQYLAALKHGGLALDELEEIALNAVRVSLLPDEEKQNLLGEFKQVYETLRAEHVAPQAT